MWCGGAGGAGHVKRINEENLKSGIMNSPAKSVLICYCKHNFITNSLSTILNTKDIMQSSNDFRMDLGFVWSLFFRARNSSIRFEEGFNCPQKPSEEIWNDDGIKVEGDNPFILKFNNWLFFNWRFYPSTIFGLKYAGSWERSWAKVSVNIKFLPFLHVEHGGFRWYIPKIVSLSGIRSQLKCGLADQNIALMNLCWMFEA